MANWLTKLLAPRAASPMNALNHLAPAPPAPAPAPAPSTPPPPIAASDAARREGNACLDRDDLPGAIACYRRAVALAPEAVDSLVCLGFALTETGQWAEARVALQQARRLKPDHFDAAYLLGKACAQSRELAEAVPHYQHAISLQPAFEPAYRELFQVLRELGRYEAALQVLLRAEAVMPGSADLQQNLGFIHLLLHRSAEAESHSRKALAIDPKNMDAHNNLGALLLSKGRFIEAEASARAACALAPASAVFRSNLGGCLLRQGRLAEAIDCFREAAPLDPRHIESGSNLLFALSAEPATPPSAYLAEARRMGERLSAVAGDPFTDWPAAGLRAARPLRVGFLSGHLSNGSIGYFLEGVLRHVHPAVLQLVAYDTDEKHDATHSRLRPLIPEWHGVRGMRAADLASKIRNDAVQILIDLNGHTDGNSLPVFALKPAPLQVSWLGYWASTGLPTMDVVLADPVCLPPKDHAHFTERVVDLPHTRLCFTPPTEPLPVGPLPALGQPAITFASYQALTKVHDGVLGVWARVLAAVPNARLHLTSHQVNDALFQQQFNAKLAAAGIDPARVRLSGPLPREAYLASYGQVDMVLDTFPYTGGTTTCEALWMGVPTLTLRGDSMISRQGASMLTCVGLPGWIAEDEDDYVAKAVAHANDLEGLKALRAGLRERALASPLFDARRFAKDLEAVLCRLWDERQARPEAGDEGDKAIP
ncbi:MAG: glycosyltransferase [Rhodoferax sp.]|nr:glycosyltransferase [Rhodoferax sp.]